MQAKKWATEVALNALRARVPERSARLALVRVLPDENAQTGKESDHQPDRYHTSDNHVVEEHAGLPIRLPLSDGYTLTNVAAGKIDQCQWCPRPGTRAGRRVDLRQVSALLGLALGLLLGLADRQDLLEDLAHLVEALVVEVVDTLVALGGEIDQLVVIAHSGNRIRRKVRFRRGAQAWRVFAT